MQPIITVEQGGWIRVLAATPFLFTGNRFSILTNARVEQIGTTLEGLPIYELLPPLTFDRTVLVGSYA